MDNIICLKPFYFMEFAGYGEVFSCCPGWIKEGIGNIKVNTIEEIWNSPKNQFIREKMLKGEWADICKPICPIINKYLATGESIKLDDLHRDHCITPELESEIKAGKTILKSMPTYFNFSNSGICNLDCIMCCWRCMKEDTIAVQKAYDDVSPYLRNAREIILSGGGDPFVRPDTRKMLLEFNRVSYPQLKINLLTNGVLLPKFWERIKHLNFGYINVSIDAATKETYEKIRRRSKWEALLFSLSVIKENKEKFDFVTINMTVMKENYREIPLFVELGKDFGFNVSFQRVRTEGKLDPSSNFFESGDQDTLSDFIEIINNINARKYSINIDWTNLIGYMISNKTNQYKETLKTTSKIFNDCNADKVLSEIWNHLLAHEWTEATQGLLALLRYYPLVFIGRIYHKFRGNFL